MSATRLPIAVIVATADIERIAEALRAAVGLSLRGDRVQLLLNGAAAAAAEATADPRLARGLATLEHLGHEVRRSAEASAIATAARAARAVEVWT